MSINGGSLYIQNGYSEEIRSGGSYYYNGGCVAGACTASDIRLKKNVAPLVGAIDTLLKVKGVTYEWKNPEQHENRAGTQIGIIAQDVEKVFPEWVSETPQGTKVVNIDARTMAAVTIESIRTLKAENDDLRARVKALEERRSVASNAGGLGMGLAGLGLAVAGVFAFGRRRREGERV